MVIMSKRIKKEETEDKIIKKVGIESLETETCDLKEPGFHRQNNKESPNNATNQCEAQSIGDRDELSGCTKNPGHKEFIPIGTFSLKHLPEGYCDNDLYKYIKATSDLTVRVDVRMTSPNRPVVWPDLNVPYPFYNIKKSTNLRTGSGMISDVWEYTDGVGNQNGCSQWNVKKKCWCKNCERSDSPSNVWWEFRVATATHVVFDDIEASNTYLRLFYDSDVSPVVSVDKVSVDYVNIRIDWCKLKCVTCDKSVGNRLMEKWKHYKQISKVIKNKYVKSKNKVRLSFILSHPHGCSKQVSVGQWKDKHLLGDLSDGFKFTYTTCTCPGSSGALVHCIGYDTLGGWRTDLVHSRCESGLNHSADGGVYLS